MKRAPAKASTVESFVGTAKLTGFPARSTGRHLDLPCTCVDKNFSAFSQLQSRAANPNFSMRSRSEGENAISEKGLSTIALFGRNLTWDTPRTSPWRSNFKAEHFLGSHCLAL